MKRWDARTKGAGLEKLWNNKFAEYKAAFPKEAAEFERRMKGELPANWAAHAAEVIAKTNEKAETIATRKASQNAINALAPALPEFLGGSADLTGSNLTNWTGCTARLAARSTGNYISYGVREFGMSHIMNGMALHGGLLPFGGTFLMFSEYARNALRMSALMKQRVIYVFTHDSIGLGEDGPTHQPVEQTATLRMIPNMEVWRPCDTVESAVAWVAAVERKRRSDLPDLQPPEPPLPEARCRARSPTSPRAAMCWPMPPAPKTGAHRHRLRSAAGGGGQEGAGRAGHRGPRGVDALDQCVRPAGPGLQGQRAAPRASSAWPIEAGVTDGWYKYVGLRRRSGRHRPLRRIRPGRRAVQALRLHRRERGQDGQRHSVTVRETTAKERRIVMFRKSWFQILFNLGEKNGNSKLVSTVLAASAAWCSAQ